MQDSRQPGDTKGDGSALNADQPKKQPTGLIKALESPLFTALVTAVSAIVLFGYNRIIEVDARLDELEKEARLLLDSDGTAAASPEALESYYGVQELRRRMERLEGIHSKGH